MPIEPYNLKLVTVFRDRHGKGAQTTIDCHLGDRRDLVRRALIVNSLSEARPERHLAMSPAGLLRWPWAWPQLPDSTE
jgi:hypothetical protein